MADAGSSGDVAKAIGDPLGAIVGWLAGVLPEGPARTLLYVVVGLCVAAAPFIYRYYLGVLAQGAAPEESIERQDYDKLRASLAGGNLAARLYAKWLTDFLDWIERFFGDVGLASRTPFLPRFLRLRDPAPLWTAPAFDRCLLLALIYPIATIFLIWAISGHVGPAETALGLKRDVPDWSRGLAVVALGLAVFAMWRTNVVTARKQVGWSIVASSGLLAALATGASLAVNVACLAGYSAVRFAAAGVFAVAFAVASALLFDLADFVFSGAGTGTGIVAGAGSVTVAYAAAAAVASLNKAAIKRGWQGRILALFVAALVLICFITSYIASSLEDWKPLGAFLLVLGLLTLLNAPFDWASLGLTRALLRRGLELRGWWPYLLALVDACLAGVIVALLAFTMVVCVQAFDELAVHGGGKPVLPLDTLFDGIAKNPGAPEYWWVYALLLSSMIPSLINLAIGGMAFTRGIPLLARVILNWIPEGKAVPEYKRQPAAIGLTVQMFAGAGLGIAAQAFLAWGVIFHLLPALGLDLLDMARAVAAFDLPARLGQLFAGSS